MKKYISILVVLLVVIVVSGCTSSPQTSNQTKTYNANGISFQYPADWNDNAKTTPTNALNESTLADLGNNENRVVVNKLDIPPSINVTLEWLAQSHSSYYIERNMTISNKTITIDGVNAIQIDATSKNGKNHGSSIILKKNNTIYYITIGTPENNQQARDMILNSFKIQ